MSERERERFSWKSGVLAENRSCVFVLTISPPSANRSAKSLFVFLTSGDGNSQRMGRMRKGKGKDGQSRRHFESEGIYDRVLGVYRVAEAVTEGFATN